MTTRLTDQQLHAMATSRGIAPGFVPKPERKKRDNEESRMQRYVVRWFAANCHRWNLPHIALFSIPNGGNGSAKRGSIMKAEGQKKGVPDVMICVAKLGRMTKLLVSNGYVDLKDYWYGLFIEFKTETGRLSPEQVEYHALLTAQGYCVHVCRSVEEAIKAVEEYLS